MERGLHEEAAEAREVGRRVVGGAAWVVLPAGRVDLAFVPDAVRGCLTGQGSPVRVCAAQSAGYR